MSGKDSHDSRAWRSSEVEAADARTTRFFRLALTEPSPMLDRLRHRVAGESGQEWFRATITRALGDPAHADTPLDASPPPLERLEALKERCKSTAAARATTDEQLEAFLLYFVSLAVAIHHYRQVLTRRAPEDLEAALLDIAGISPPAWKELFGRSAIQLSAA